MTQDHNPDERGGAPCQVVPCGWGQQWGGDGEGSGERGVNRDGVDASFKLRSSGKIVVDIGAR